MDVSCKGPKELLTLNKVGKVMREDMSVQQTMELDSQKQLKHTLQCSVSAGVLLTGSAIMVMSNGKLWHFLEYLTADHVFRFLTRRNRPFRRNVGLLFFSRHWLYRLYYFLETKWMVLIWKIKFHFNQ